MNKYYQNKKNHTFFGHKSKLKKLRSHRKGAGLRRLFHAAEKRNAKESAITQKQRKAPLKTEQSFGTTLFPLKKRKWQGIELTASFNTEFPALNFTAKN